MQHTGATQQAEGCCVQWPMLNVKSPTWKIIMRSRHWTFDFGNCLPDCRTRHSSPQSGLNNIAPGNALTLTHIYQGPDRQFSIAIMNRRLERRKGHRMGTVLAQQLFFAQAWRTRHGIESALTSQKPRFDEMWVRVRALPWAILFGPFRAALLHSAKQLPTLNNYLHTAPCGLLRGTPASLHLRR